MGPRVFAAALIACAIGCKSEEQFNREFIEKELASLDTALAAGNETRVVTSCAVLEGTSVNMPPALAERIARGCFVEAPRLILQRGIANVVENKRKHPDPELVGLNCAELFVPGALQTLAKHPTTDPALQKLADEYTRLCPAEAAKARAGAAG